MAPVRGWKEVKTGGDDRAKLTMSEDWVPGGEGHRENGANAGGVRDRGRKRREGETGHKDGPLWSDGRILNFLEQKKL